MKLKNLAFAVVAMGVASGVLAQVKPEDEKFKTAYDKMVGEVKKLPAAAGVEATLKAQVGEVGKACKGCHDDFRLKEFRN